LIVDTSALIAILKREDGCAILLEAIGMEGGCLPAPAHVEFMLVAAGLSLTRQANDMFEACQQQGLLILAFGPEHAGIVVKAGETYGKGNGRGGKLNLLDLMVYAVARERGEPLLCTGKDYATTDLVLHQASRPW
jgi:ribonuclease VapC